MRSYIAACPIDLSPMINTIGGNASKIKRFEGRNDARDLILAVILLLASGNPVLSVYEKIIVYFFVMLPMVYCYAKGPRHSLKQQDVVFIFVFVLALVVLHAIEFGVSSLYADLGFVMRMLVALMFVVSAQRPFRAIAMAMAVLAGVSLLFYLPETVGVNLRGAMAVLSLPTGDATVQHIGVHNFGYEGSQRNSGVFWEPGAFAGYLSFGLLCALSERGREISKRYIVLLVFALLTTQSTTGYFVLAAISGGYVLQKMKGKGALRRAPFLVLSVLALFFVFASVYKSSDFLEKKLVEQFETAGDDIGGASLTRFSNLLVDIEYIKERPVLGWSANPNVRVERDAWLEDLVVGFGNGFSGFVVSFGIPLMAVYTFRVYMFFRNRGEGEVVALVYMIAVVMILNGEQFLNFPALLALFFSQKGQA